MIVALWWDAVGTELNDVRTVPKIFCGLISMLLQNAAKPSLILHHYKSSSISLPLRSQHPSRLLILSLSPLLSRPSPTSSSSLPFSPSSSYSLDHSSSVTIISSSVFALSPPFPSSPPRQVITKPWWDIEGGREGGLVSPVRRREMMRESGALSGWHNVTE